MPLLVAGCDGFEDGFDSRYDASANNGTWTVDGQRRYRGASALHLWAASGSGDAGGTLGPIVSADESNFVNIDPRQSNLRVFLYVAGQPVSGALRLLSLGGLQLYLADGDLVLGGGERAGVTMPMDRWVCVELQLIGPNLWQGSIRVDDGPSVPMGTAIGTAVNGFSLQLQHNDPTRAVDLWFDELVLDDHPIGCGS